MSIVFPRLKLYVDCFDISYFIMNSIDKSMNDFDMYQHMHRYSDMKKRFIIQLVSQLVFSYPLRRGYYDVLPRTRKNSCHIKNNWTRYLSTIYCNQYNFLKYYIYSITMFLCQLQFYNQGLVHQDWLDIINIYLKCNSKVIIKQQHPKKKK